MSDKGEQEDSDDSLMKGLLQKYQKKRISEIAAQENKEILAS